MSALAGKRIVNTRALHQAAELDELLRALGAVPLSYPCIAIESMADSAELDRALADLCMGEFDWLTLTSANAVHSVTSRMEALRVCCRKPLQNGGDVPRFRTAVIGPSTCEAARRELGLAAEVMPASYRGIELAAAMPIEPGQRVLIPQSEIAAPDLADALRAKGALVTAVAAYRTVTGSGGVDLPALLSRGEVDAIVFASSSALDGCAARLASERESPVRLSSGSLAKRAGLPWQTPTGHSVDSQPAEGVHQHASTDSLRMLDGVAVVCIGPNTAKTAGAYGLSPIVPEEQTLAGVICALEMELAALSKGLAS